MAKSCPRCWREYQRMRILTTCRGLLWLLLLGAAARAASPTVTSVMPRGGQRGTEIDITLAGDRLADAQEILFYQPGITVKTLQPTTQQVKAHIAIAADARLGEVPLRLRTASGISEM